MNKRPTLAAHEQIGARGLPAPYHQIDPPTIQEIIDWVRGGTRNPNVVLSKQQAKDVANQLFSKNAVLLQRNKEAMQFIFQFVSMVDAWAQALGKIADTPGSDDVAVAQMKQLAKDALMNQAVAAFAGKSQVFRDRGNAPEKS